MYIPSSNRYTDTVGYRFCGKSGLKLPQIALGLWQNFGDINDQKEAARMIHFAFDKGITHFDLANNYGVPYGSAEVNFGTILKRDLLAYRDELIISSKAGHEMWLGPYGNGGSRKYLMASLHQSLKRMQIAYVDIFYSHRYDPETPLEETMAVLSDMVRQGKALYVGISKYPEEKARQAYELLRHNGTPCLVYQGRYNLLTHEVEREIFPSAMDEGVGFVGFSPLAQGLLSNRYLNGIPANSRAQQGHFLKKEQITEELLGRLKALSVIANRRGQSLSQMALAWTLRRKEVSSVIVGASSLEQLQDSVMALKNGLFSDNELLEIHNIVVNGSI